MDIALTLSVIAVVVSAGSALFIYLQASATRALANAGKSQLDIIREQWHDVQRPRIRAVYHLADSHEAITFINDGPIDVESGTLEIGDVGHQLIKAIGGHQRVDQFAWPVGSGDSYVITRLRMDAGRATFRLTCTSRDGRSWTTAIACEIPAAPPPNVS